MSPHKPRLCVTAGVAQSRLFPGQRLEFTAWNLILSYGDISK